MGGGAGRMTPEAGQLFAAHRADQSALDDYANKDAGLHYPGPPQAGLNQPSIDGSKPIGESITHTDRTARTTSHQIDDINVINTKDGTTPSSLLRDGKPASEQLVPAMPHRHLHDYSIKRDGFDTSSTADVLRGNGVMRRRP